MEKQPLILAYFLDIHNSDFTITTNATCTLKGSDDKWLRSTILRNAGRLVWTSDGDVWAISGGGTSYVYLTNLVGGECKLTIQNGTAQFPAGFYSNGVLDLASNMVVNLAGSAISFGPNSHVTGEGQLAISSGGVTVNGTVRNLLWTGCRLVNSSLTIATNGTLTIDGSGEKGIVFSSLNNAGTVRWTGTGDVRAKSSGVTNNTVLITNLPGAVFDFQTDADFLYDHSGGFFFLCVFDNQGTLRKSAGTGESLFPPGMIFTSSGYIDIQTGTFSVNEQPAPGCGEIRTLAALPAPDGRSLPSMTAPMI